jgi:hypothetical protein
MTDGGGIFIALTSCRDEERVEEFVTRYQEVQFRNALAVDGVDAATLYGSKAQVVARHEASLAPLPQKASTNFRDSCNDQA